MNNHLYGKIPVSPSVITPFNPPNQDDYLDDLFDAFTDSDNNPFIDSNS